MGKVLLDMGFDGTVHHPGDDHYDAARLPWNRRLDPRPAVVADAAGPAGVQAAVRTARDHGIPFAVQSTGHGTVVPADNGLLLKTSRCSAVDIDPQRRTARVGAGAVWSDVIAAAAPYGLAPLSGTPWIGVAGYTLGGGTGWLSRTYGFAADSLLRAEVVTSEGDLAVASGEENPDLLWALRGGGGNFGVATALEFRLYPVERVCAGTSFHAVERAPETLARYRAWAEDEPDASNTAIMLTRMPASPQVPEPVRGKHVLAVRTFFLGEAEEAGTLLAPLLDAAGPALLGGFGDVTFEAAGTALAGPPAPPMAVRQHIDLFDELPDNLFDLLLQATGPGKPIDAVELRHWGGAMARPAADAGPVGHRHSPFSVIATAMTHPADVSAAAEEPASGTGMDDLAARLRSYATGGSFLNFLADPDRAATAYTPAAYQRLAEVKRTWDPDNFFHLNHNIPPSPSGGQHQ